jgi:hypothetical protein
MSKISRAEYYERVFERFEKDHKHTWNRSAFFCFGLWMLYQKMYMYSFACFAFCCVYKFGCTSFLELDDNLLFFVRFICNIFIGIVLGQIEESLSSGLSMRQIGEIVGTHLR